MLALSLYKASSRHYSHFPYIPQLNSTKLNNIFGLVEFFLGFMLSSLTIHTLSNFMSDSITPSEEIGLAIADTARLWRVKLDRRLQPLALAGSDGLLQRELAELVGVEAPTMAGLLDRMEKEGWIHRQVQADDRRAKITTLTAQADEVVAVVKAEALALQKAACAGIDSARLRECYAVLDEIKQSLQRS
jgi:MarR family transcriptional regulator for hemolysin